MTPKPRFTPMEQRILFQIHTTLGHGLSSWLCGIEYASGLAGWDNGNVRSSAEQFEFAKQNFFAAKELYKLFGGPDNGSFSPKEKWLQDTFPLVFEEAGVGGYILSENFGKTEEKNGTKYAMPKTVTKSLTDSYFAELNRLYKMLDKKIIDDLRS